MAKKTLDERAAALEQKRAKLAQQLTEVKAKAAEESRKREDNLRRVVGAAVLSHAQKNPTFQKMLLEVVNTEVTKPADREAVAAYLVQPAPPSVVVTEQASE